MLVLHFYYYCYNAFDLKTDYGKDQAHVIMNITGNIISGQVSRETAKQLSGSHIETSYEGKN